LNTSLLLIVGDKKAPPHFQKQGVWLVSMKWFLKGLWWVLCNPPLETVGLISISYTNF